MAWYGMVLWRAVWWGGGVVGCLVVGCLVVGCLVVGWWGGGVVWCSFPWPTFTPQSVWTVSSRCSTSSAWSERSARRCVPRIALASSFSTPVRIMFTCCLPSPAKQTVVVVMVVVVVVVVVVVAADL